LSSQGSKRQRLLVIGVGVGGEWDFIGEHPKGHVLFDTLLKVIDEQLSNSRDYLAFVFR